MHELESVEKARARIKHEKDKADSRLRDEFAMCAVTVVDWGRYNTEDCARCVYEIADAMLKAREK